MSQLEQTIIQQARNAFAELRAELDVSFRDTDAFQDAHSRLYALLELGHVAGSGMSQEACEQLARIEQEASNLVATAPTEAEGRVQQIRNCAMSLHQGDQAAAARWLETPLIGLDGAKPIEMADTWARTGQVVNLAGRLLNGASHNGGERP